MPAAGVYMQNEEIRYKIATGSGANTYLKGFDNPANPGIMQMVVDKMSTPSIEGFK
jgi:hypothetical protein